MPRPLSRPPLLPTLFLSLALALTLTYLHPTATSHLEPLRQAWEPMHSAFEERVRPKLREVVEVWAGSPAFTTREGDLADQLSHVVFTPHPHSLPKCERSFIYRLHGSRPFAEEILRMMRSIAVAERMGYEVFVRSEGWKWGEWADYFIQPTQNCTLQGTPLWSERKGMNPSSTLFGGGSEPLAEAEVEGEGDSASSSDADSEDSEQQEEEEEEDYASPAWSSEAHIWDGTSDAYLTPLFLAHHTSPPRLHRLQQLELASYPPSPGRGPSLDLDGGESEIVPAEMGEAYRAMREVLERWWVLNPEIEENVRREVVQWGWEEEEREVVGVGVGLSDECPEERENKYSPLRTEQTLRVRRMQEVLKQWTVLSRKTDSLVVSQASEVGRLLTLLAGPEMIKAGRVLSVDVRWFPGTYYS
ncbi:hypothetical protein BCR35DRAFT_31932 [Leucosporidium creatinivorum]|uniref:Uncharacterized protein n=1 Tax=Leucosporidium creatinivorum TaxID=106004 RepID=A0A1Y2FXS7_9BASI|nr:hypothetical protein BCR35DRAFT_31932 [Leucosporidium creatinivorum]